MTDTNRLTTHGAAFYEEKHHLLYTLGKAPSFPRYVMERMSTTGDDVRSSVETLVREFAKADAVFAAWIASGTGMLAFPEGARMATAFKGVHLWLRAYQDALCGVILTLGGNTVGANPTMTKVLKQGNPVSDFVVARLPEYGQWFAEWRDLRNEMKRGTSFTTVFADEPFRVLGIGFANPEQSDAEHVREGFISLESVILGLDMSTQLTALVREATPGSR